jgi:hypothetical protein
MAASYSSSSDRLRSRGGSKAGSYESSCQPYDGPPSRPAQVPLAQQPIENDRLAVAGQAPFATENAHRVVDVAEGDDELSDVHQTVGSLWKLGNPLDRGPPV